MKAGRLKTPIILFVACLPCCLPLLGIGGAAFLATAGSVLTIEGVTLLGVATTVAAAFVFILAANGHRNKRQVQPVMFFEMEPDDARTAKSL